MPCRWPTKGLRRVHHAHKGARRGLSRSAGGTATTHTLPYQSGRQRDPVPPTSLLLPLLLPLLPLLLSPLPVSSALYTVRNSIRIRAIQQRAGKSPIYVAIRLNFHRSGSFVGRFFFFFLSISEKPTTILQCRRKSRLISISFRSRCRAPRKPIAIAIVCRTRFEESFKN